MADNCSAPEVHLLGEIVVAWGNLELGLEVTLTQLLTGSQGRSVKMAMAMTSGMSFKQKVEALNRMFLASMDQQTDNASAKADLKTLLKGLLDAEAERNKLIHSAWNYSEAFGGDFTRMKAARDRPMRGFHRTPAKIIEATLEQIAAVSQSLARFTVKYIQAAEAP